jgi:hypothetical protein
MNSGYDSRLRSWILLFVHFPQMNSFHQRYSRYTDSELAAVLLRPTNYTPEAVEAAKLEAASRGGEDSVISGAREEEHQKVVEKFRKDVQKKLAAGATPEDLIASFSGSGLTIEKMREVISEKHEEHEEEVSDTTKTLQSIIMSIVGGAISIIPGSIYTAYSITIVFGGRSGGAFSLLIVGILIIGLGAMCYGIVYYLSGRKRTLMVMIMSVLATFISFWLGFGLAYTVVLL